MDNDTKNGMAEEEARREVYFTSIHRLGRWSTAAALALMFAVPLVVTLVYPVRIDFPSLLNAAFSLSVIFLPVCVIEVVSYTPILGAGGTYLAFITGNIMNMKLPAATAGMRVADTEPGTDKGEVVSALAVGTSAVTTTLIVFAGMFVFMPFIEYLRNPILQPAFANIIPSLVAAMLVPMLKRNWRLCALPLGLSLLFGLTVPLSTYHHVHGYLLLTTLVVSVGAYILYKRAKDGKRAEE